MNTYETVFITPPNLSEDDERATVESMSQIVKEGGGTIHANDRMGRRRLAYPIQKFEDGVYTRFLYDSENSVPRELERRMRIADSVLRSITVRLERDWAKAAKEQAIIDAQRRVEEAREAERRAAEAAAEEARKAAAGEAEDAASGEDAAGGSATGTDDKAAAPDASPEEA